MTILNIRDIKLIISFKNANVMRFYIEYQTHRLFINTSVVLFVGGSVCKPSLETNFDQET
jgi:hypothetical protein